MQNSNLLVTPPPPGGNSISGKVVTNRGEEVPKAYVFAHTDDWLYWYETTVMETGFSFEGLRRELDRLCGSTL